MGRDIHESVNEEENPVSSGTNEEDTAFLERTIVINAADVPRVNRPKEQKTYHVHTRSATVSATDITEYDTLFDLSYPEKENQVDFTTSIQHDNLPDPEAHVEKKFSFASGGQGILYQGFDSVLHRLIAIKSLRKEWFSHEARRKAFISEARITAQLEHPSVLPIHSLFREEGGGVAVSMKMLRGKTLESYLSQVCSVYDRTKFDSAVEARSLQLRFDIFLKICDALEYAHNRNVLHCDLKPENIMIGEYHDAYLMDWGIAHPIRSKDYNPKNWVKKKTVSGTPSFIAPEALQGDYCDQRADIYAMGLILFEIVTLKKAFPGKNRTEIFEKVCQHDMSPLGHKYGYPVPADLKAIIEKASAFDPGERYSHIGEMASDIRKYLRRDEVSARPDTFSRRIYRKCVLKHGRTTIIVLLGFLLAVVGYSAVSLWNVLTKERSIFETERITTRRTAVIARNYVQCLDTANRLDRELTEIEYSLYERARLFTNFLTDQIKTRDWEIGTHTISASAYSTPGQVPSSYKSYPQYGGKYDFEHISFVGNHDIHSAEMKKRMRSLEAMFDPIREMMMSSEFGSRLTAANKQLLWDNMLLADVPVTAISFSFTDGFYCCYPGDALPADFDPRTREWYKTRINPISPEAGWSVPYLDYTNHGFGITYSLRVRRTDQSVIGVAALILDLSRVAAILTNSADTPPYVLEKTFLDASGSVIITTDHALRDKMIAKYSHAKNSGGFSKGFLYPNSELLNMVMNEQNGYIIQHENGKQVAYVFASCRKLNWFFVQKVDLNRALE